jgi:ADP-heptose:LPS heptosyltransferase/predicted SAM-dependent methyltransferase
VVWKPENPEGHESLKIKYDIVPYTRGRVLDLGSGTCRTYNHFITVDSMEDWNELNRRPDIVCDVSDLSMFASGQFDSVFSSHVLEHLKDTESALKQWFRVIKNNGYLVLYLPHRDFYPNIGKEGSNPYHLHDFIPRDIIDIMKKIGSWDLIISEPRNQNDEYSFLQVYQKLSGSQQLYSYAKEKPTKTCAIVRYGGFGDMIQLSPILASLKNSGYHNTIYTTPRAWDIIKNDPNADSVMLQDTDQVPNQELKLFWDCIASKYDKFVNLSESVEGSFLAMPGRAPFYWTTAARHNYMNHNYEDMAHDIAGVKKIDVQKFYPTDDEIKNAKKLREKIGGKLVMFTMAGSGINKIYPWVDQIISHFMLTTKDVKFVMVGGTTERDLLEWPWEKESRVIKMCGKLSIRDTMALARLCDVVFGPETGVLNSVAYEDVAKVVLLSHSSVENLTKYWKNTTSLYSENCPCYPCHKMIYGWDHCIQEKDTGVSLCQAMITPDISVNAIEKALK